MPTLTLSAIEQQHTPVRTLPPLRAGYTVAVHQRIKEGDKERIQIFEGIIIATKGSGPRRMITVRRIASGVGVERTFPVLSPLIAKIEIKKKAKVRRAKLYYLRHLTGRAAQTEDDREGFAELQVEVAKLAEETLRKEKEEAVRAAEAAAATAEKTESPAASEAVTPDAAASGGAASPATEKKA